MTELRDEMVLLVEDDAATAELETRILQRAGLSVRATDTVHEAVRLLRQERFLAVVLDYQLPDGQPWAVVEAAKEKLPEIPVIIVTAMGNELIAAEALHRGVADYIKKSAAFWDELPDIVMRVTRLKAAEDKLRRANALFELIAENTSDVILVGDLDGTASYISPACKQLLGYLPHELIERLGLDLVHPGDRDSLITTLTRLSDSETCTAVFRCLRKDGEHCWIESNINLLREPETGTTRVIAISRDITARKRAEEEIEKLNRSLETMLTEVHHRVKNNLQVISSLLQMQSANLKDEMAIAALEASQQRVYSMALIHEQLYATPDVAQVDFDSYADTLLTQLMFSFATSDDRVKSRLEASPICLNIDQAVPCALIMNELVTNALKHAYPDGATGEILVELKQPKGNHIELTVSDDGIGLPENFHIEGGGSLGLRIADILSKQLEGSLTFQRQPRTTFTLEFRSDTKLAKSVSAA